MLTTRRPVLQRMVQCTQKCRPGDKASPGQAKMKKYTDTGISDELF